MPISPIGQSSYLYTFAYGELTLFEKYYKNNLTLKLYIGLNILIRPFNFMYLCAPKKLFI
jgi:hypothetical protein